MLIHLVALARNLQAQTFWFDARQSALGFYEHHGFQATGDIFYKQDIAYLRMSRRLDVR
ncbi:hypothetical protein NBRC116601_13950 [Cognatishimia sp. WU-CL00825]